MREKLGKIIRFILTVYCLIVFCFSGYKLWDYYQAQHSQEKIKQQVELIIQLPEKIEEEKEWVPNFEELRKINQDVVGFIHIPNTNINYPVMYIKNDNDTYLHRDLNKNYNVGGSIWVDGLNRNGTLEDRLTTIYGHNMANNSMFGDIKKFGNKDFFDNNKTFYYFTPEKSYKAEIIVYKRTTVHSKVYDNRHLVLDDKSALEYIKDFPKGYTGDLTLNPGQKLMLLSTCTDAYDSDNRTVILAKLTERKMP